MTLAATFLLIISSGTPFSSQIPLPPLQNAAQSSDEKPAASGSQSPTASAQSGAAPASPPSSAAPAQATPDQKAASSKRMRHKKASVSPECDSNAAGTTSSAQTAPGGSSASAPANTQPAPASPAPASPAPGSTAGNTDTAAAKPANCPPSKVLVRHGGTADPTIQLVGGAAGAPATDARQTASVMLESTEANLKKIQESQLSSDQQEIVKQVHQFVDQSKAATTAGDVDRARTLAWKAQLLSEELLKPQN